MNAAERAKLERQCADWNAAHAVGAPVIVTLDSENEFTTTTRSRAQVLSGHTAVIWLTGIVGCYLLDRVRSIEPPAWLP